uniref:Uncharacterized protein n=1 Tax=Arundo donax TaxID=35708 RepID=A0A0A9H0V1_ARUDO
MNSTLSSNAAMAASFTSDDRSAPVRLLHSSRRASASKSTTDEMGLFLACAFNIETRSSAPGKGT